MENISESDVKKLSPIFRALAAFILLCSILSMAGVIFAVATEPFHPSAIIGVVVSALLGHVSYSIVFKGYAPKYFLFAHGPK